MLRLQGHPEHLKFLSYCIASETVRQTSAQSWNKVHAWQPSRSKQQNLFIYLSNCFYRWYKLTSKSDLQKLPLLRLSRNITASIVYYCKPKQIFILCIFHFNKGQNNKHRQIPSQRREARKLKGERCISLKTNIKCQSSKIIPQKSVFVESLSVLDYLYYNIFFLLCYYFKPLFRWVLGCSVP